MNSRQSRSIVMVCLMLTALLVAGCSESQQDKYNDAISNLNDAKQQQKQDQDKVNDAQKKLDDAKKKLQQSSQKVSEVKQSVNKTVNDDVLFRTLQKKLLNNDDFSQAAISVGVHQRVVTLTGTVPDKQTRKQAVQAAQSQAGVAHVNDQLEISHGKDDDAQGSSKNGEGKGNQTNSADGGNG